MIAGCVQLVVRSGMAEDRLKTKLQMRASKDREEDLALFLEVKQREQENINLLTISPEFDTSTGLKLESSPTFNISTSLPVKQPNNDDFLSSDHDKNDYDWLLTPPSTPLFPALEMDAQKMSSNKHGNQKVYPTATKSMVTNHGPRVTTGATTAAKQVASPRLNSSGSGFHRPSSSSGSSSRPATPTGRPKTMTPNTKPSRPSTPTSRASLPSFKSTASTPKPSTPEMKPVSASLRASAPTTTKSMAPSRSSTPSRPAIRSSTPTRTAIRSSTPTSRSSAPPSRTTSRAATPTRTPSSTPSVTPTYPLKSSPSTNSSPTVRKSMPSSTSAVKPRPWNPSEMPGFSFDVPPNLRTSALDRPLSTTRGRPGALTSRGSPTEPNSSGRPRRQSCSPSRGRALGSSTQTGSGSVPASTRARSRVRDTVSPVEMGAKMVERVVNMRKLPPPNQDDKHSQGSVAGRSPSPDSSGFGRSLSKKSLDMAIRHMDIRRNLPGNLRPSMTNFPASSTCSVRSGQPRSRTVSVSDSPLATSSNASSDISVNNIAMETEEEIGSEKCFKSPLPGR